MLGLWLIGERPSRPPRNRSSASRHFSVHVLPNGHRTAPLGEFDSYVGGAMWERKQVRGGPSSTCPLWDERQQSTSAPGSLLLLG